MRNERGFFTVVGLCLLLAVAISIRGVQEFEGNYSIGASNAQAELELQNAANSAIAEIIETGTYTKNVTSKRLGKISISVSHLTDGYSETNYVRMENGSRVQDQNKISEKLSNSVVWVSVASCENKKFGGKMSCKSQAYVADDGTVCFMNDS